MSPPFALPDRIQTTLKRHILTCAMRPGERIVEKTPCAEMQMSRTPLREALNRLTTMLMTALDQHQRPLSLGLGGGVDGNASAAGQREVVEAVAAKRASRARSLMIEHLTHGEKRISSGFAPTGTEAVSQGSRGARRERTRRASAFQAHAVGPASRVHARG